MTVHGPQALRRRRGRTAADRGLHATLGSDASHELLRIGAPPNVCGLTVPAIGAIPDRLKAE